MSICGSAGRFYMEHSLSRCHGVPLEGVVDGFYGDHIRDQIVDIRPRSLILLTRCRERKMHANSVELKLGCWDSFAPPPAIAFCLRHFSLVHQSTGTRRKQAACFLICRALSS